MDRTEWRCKGVYIHATSYDGERISDVEIGSYEGGTIPLKELKKRPPTCEEDTP